MDNFSALTEVCLSVFNTTCGYTNLFVPVLFLVRISYANITGSSSGEYSDAFKGLVTYWVLILGFPYILDLLFLLPDTFAPSFDPAKVLSASSVPSSGPIGSDSFPIALRYLLETLTSIVYYIAVGIHFVLMIVMCGIAPVVILFATMLGLGIGVKIFFGLLVLAGCWPILWSALDQFNRWLQMIGGNSFASLIGELLVQTLKTIAPLWVSSMALKSGPGKALTGAVSGALKRSGVSSFFKKKPASSTNGPGGKTGTRGSYPNRQMKSGGSNNSNRTPASSSSSPQSQSISPTSQSSTRGSGSTADRPLAPANRSIPKTSPAEISGRSSNHPIHQPEKNISEHGNVHQQQSHSTPSPTAQTEFSRGTKDSAPSSARFSDAQTSHRESNSRIASSSTSSSPVPSPNGSSSHPTSSSVATSASSTSRDFSSLTSSSTSNPRNAEPSSESKTVSDSIRSSTNDSAKGVQTPSNMRSTNETPSRSTSSSSSKPPQTGGQSEFQSLAMQQMMMDDKVKRRKRS